MDLLLQIALFLLLGVVLHFLDGLAGTALYRLWYNMTHKDPLLAGERRGFLQQQPLRVRLYWALALTILAALAVLSSGSFFQDTTRILLNLLAMLVGLSAGFLLAPGILAALPDKWNKASRYLEETEKNSAAGLPPAAADDRAPAGPAHAGQAGPNSPSDSKAVAASRENPSPGTPQAPAAHLAKPDANPGSNPDAKPDWRKGVDEFLNKP